MERALSNRMAPPDAPASGRRPPRGGRAPGRAPGSTRQPPAEWHDPSVAPKTRGAASVTGWWMFDFGVLPTRLTDDHRFSTTPRATCAAHSKTETCCQRTAFFHVASAPSVIEGMAPCPTVPLRTPRRNLQGLAQSGWRAPIGHPGGRKRQRHGSARQRRGIGASAPAASAPPSITTPSPAISTGRNASPGNARPPSAARPGTSAAKAASRCGAKPRDRKEIRDRGQKPRQHPLRQQQPQQRPPSAAQEIGAKDQRRRDNGDARPEAHQRRRMERPKRGSAMGQRTDRPGGRGTKKQQMPAPGAAARKRLPPADREPTRKDQARPRGAAAAWRRTQPDPGEQRHEEGQHRRREHPRIGHRGKAPRSGTARPPHRQSRRSPAPRGAPRHRRARTRARSAAAGKGPPPGRTAKAPVRAGEGMGHRSPRDHPTGGPDGDGQDQRRPGQRRRAG
jgi:hypothetical protein